MTDQVTGQPGDVMLMIARDLKKSDREGLVMGYDLGLEMQKRGVRFHIVTATPPDQARGMVTGFDALYADDVTLKTVIRSDPGFVLLHNGTITGKWSYHNLPGRDDFYGDLNALALTVLLAVAVTLPFSVNGKKEEKIVKQ
jgi:hypothetical protein